MDETYRVNKYNIVLLYIVYSSNKTMTYTHGYCLILAEKDMDLTWLFASLKNLNVLVES